MSESQEQLVETSVQKDFNETKWYIDIKLTDFAESFYIQLDAKNIFYIKFKNSLEQYVPTLVLRFTDYNFIVSKYVKFTGLALLVNIKQPIQSEELYEKDEYDGELNTMYIINNLKTIHQDKDQITYEFFAEEFNVLNFIKNINYATNKKIGDESPYKIIQAVCNKAEIVMDSDYVDTSLKINFITSQNMTVMDIIEYCLAMGAFGKNTPPSYFFSRLLDNTAMLFNQISQNPKTVEDYNLNLHITGKTIDGGNVLGNYIKNININPMQNQSVNLRNIGTKAFYDFDHDSRRWNSTVFSSENILKTLTKILNDTNTEEPSIWTNEFFLTQYINNFPNYAHYKLYNSLRDIELCTANIGFDCLGNLKRDCRTSCIYT